MMLAVLSLQSSAHPFTDLLNLNSPPAGGASLLVDVFSDSSAAASTDVSEDSFNR